MKSDKQRRKEAFASGGGKTTDFPCIRCITAWAEDNSDTGCLFLGGDQGWSYHYAGELKYRVCERCHDHNSSDCFAVPNDENLQLLLARVSFLRQRSLLPPFAVPKPKGDGMYSEEQGQIKIDKAAAELVEVSNDLIAAIRRVYHPYSNACTFHSGELTDPAKVATPVFSKGRQRGKDAQIAKEMARKRKLEEGPGDDSAFSPSKTMRKNVRVAVSKAPMTAAQVKDHQKAVAAANLLLEDSKKQLVRAEKKLPKLRSPKSIQAANEEVVRLKELVRVAQADVDRLLKG